MTLDELITYCTTRPGVEETFPFRPDILVFKVQGKMFALTGLAEPELRVNLKADPEWSVELRERYPDEVIPGWHMNKKHWNTVYLEWGDLSDALLRRMIDHSYELVVSSLPKKVRAELAAD